MEFQSIVGSDCAHCHVRILVDADGKNCKRCGLALHRRCSKSHRDECSRKAAVTKEAHDYDEVASVEWTPRLVIALALAAFLGMFGLAMYVMPPAETVPGQPAVMNKPRIAIASTLIAAGIVLAAGGWMFERSKQRR
jgi:hypothetical protein